MRPYPKPALWLCGVAARKSISRRRAEIAPAGTPVSGSVSNEDAKKTYPQGWKAPKPCIRIVPQPR